MREILKDWRIISIGAVCGCLYGAMELYFDQFAFDGPPILAKIHDLLEWGVPVIFGIFVSIVVGLHLRQKELNRQLSSKITTLRTKLLTNSD